MSNHQLLITLIPSLPLAACLLIALVGRKLGERSHWPAILALAGSFVCSAILLREVAIESAYQAGKEDSPVGYEETYTLWSWATVQGAYTPDTIAGQPTAGSVDFNIDVTLRVDPLTSIMLTMVTFVSTLVAVYSSGYMHGDRGYWRFFTYICLFVFSMTMLVSVSNFVLLYVFWEAVGACSYLLIGFWYQKPEAAAAGKKAFLVNRVGDFGFALGLFLIWTTYGTLNFHDTLGGANGVLGQTMLAGGTAAYVGGGIGLAICLLLLVGACGKSAQFPLHVWLPDAMEGPTPVSALIHAATMVTAGVYMVARCTPLFVAGSVDQPFGAQQVVAVIGGITALMAGLIALTQNDLKRVLAYSTVSQLGYMFLSLGAGSLIGIIAGMFHLFTHAFFKALLFLGAGSVMHAMGNVIDMRRFGGLRRLMPKTWWTFAFGCLALAGVFPFAGFWSKDEILIAVHDKSHEAGAEHTLLYGVLFWGALFTAFLTAFYTFRAFFMTFYGEERIPHEAGHHAHESPAPMTAPLMILAVCALLIGLVNYSHGFGDLLTRTPSLSYLQNLEHAAGHAAPIDGEHAAGAVAAHGSSHTLVAAMGLIAAVLGIGLAAFMYLGDRSQAAWLASTFRPAYALSYGKFFIDQIYTAFIVWPLRILASVCYMFDRWVIDGIVNLIGGAPPVVGAMIRSLQSGMVQFYALAMVLGVLVLIGGALIIWQAG